MADWAHMGSSGSPLILSLSLGKPQRGKQLWILGIRGAVLVSRTQRVEHPDFPKGLGLPFSHWGLGYFTWALDGTDTSLYSELRGLDGSFFLQKPRAHDQWQLLIAG